jgi:Fe2+ transport system protein FeoA
VTFVDDVIPLDLLQPGQSAFVTRIVGLPDCVQRVKEFGLRQGTEIQMFRPGNPCIIRLAGNKVCLRGDGMVRVLVARERHAD